MPGEHPVHGAIVGYGPALHDGCALIATLETDDPSDAPWARPNARGLFMPQDFKLDPEHRFCIGPAGKRLYRNGANVCIRADVGVKFRGA